MVKLAGWSLLILLACGVMLSATILTARREAIVIPPTSLSRCEQLPCYRSLLPARTTWTEAEQVLLTQPDLVIDSFTRSIYESVGSAGTFTSRVQCFVGQADRIDEIEIQYEDPAPYTLATLVNWWGTPCSAYAILGGSYIGVIFPGAAVQVRPYSRLDSRPQLRLDSPVVQINLIAGVYRCTDVEESFKAFPWRGFTNYR